MGMSKKTRKRLYAHEAEKLGLEIKPNDENGANPRYYLSDYQLSELNSIRLDYFNNTPLSIKGTSTLTDGDGKVLLHWSKKDTTQEDRIKALRVAVDALKSKIKPVDPTPINKGYKNKSICNQYTLTDYHVGMMSWAEETGADWDTKIAEDTLIKFFETAISQSPNASECILAQIGDFLHWDGLDSVTPTGKHVLDADTRFPKIVRVAIRVMRKVISMLLNKYDKVSVIMAEGNHDMASSVWMKELFHAFYENEPRVHVDVNPDPYYCFTFGKVCLFYHHGHKRRIKNLDSVFVGKYKKEFGESDFVYGHTGHLHHELKIESNLMILEQHRTLAAKDAYASRGGYLSGRDSKVITYHKDYGEVARNIINIEMLKD